MNMLSDKIEIEDSFSITTSSFVVNYSKIIASKIPLEISIFNGSLFKLPSFCNLTNENDCSDKIVLIKVYYAS